MEPVVTSAIIGGAIGGIAGEITKSTKDAIAKWINYKHGYFSKEAKEESFKRICRLVNDLMKRMFQAEKNIQNLEKTVEAAQKDPNFSTLFDDTLEAALLTGSEDKHKILSRIVAERLTSDSESESALISPLAVNAVKHLNSKLLKILGILYFIISIPKKISIKNMKMYIQLLNNHLSMYLPLEITKHDYIHLETLSCIRCFSAIYKNPKRIDMFLFKPYNSNLALLSQDTEDFMNSKLGKQLNKLWSEGLSDTIFLSTGMLIGIIVHDELTQTKSDISW